MDPPRTVSSSALVEHNNGSTTTALPLDSEARIGEVKRVTKETNVSVKINLDGSGVADSSTGIPFLDHMLDQLASHGLFDVHVKATGDIHIDDHHTNEDVALAIGTALLQALGDRKGINRFGDFSAPLDEALIHVSLDLSGRPHLSYNLEIPTQRVGTYDTQLVEHFFQSLVNTSGMTLHIRQLAGKNSHHIIEATFKAFARALRQATEYDPRRRGTVPRAKGSCFVVKTGLDFDAYVCNSLMDMYAELDCLGGLKQVFDEMSERDKFPRRPLVSSSRPLPRAAAASLLRSGPFLLLRPSPRPCSFFARRRPRSRQKLLLLRARRNPSRSASSPLSATVRGTPPALSASVRLASSAGCPRLCERRCETGEHPKIIHSSSVLHFQGFKLGSEKHTTEAIVKTSGALQSTSDIVSTFFVYTTPTNAEAEQCKELTTVMSVSHRHSAAKLIKGICISLLKSSCKTMPQLKQIQSQLFCVGLQQDRDSLNKLMAFCMVQDFHYALRIFNHIQHPSLFIYNLMIKAFVKRGSFRSAISLFHQLREHGVWPDNYTYPYVLKAIGCMGEVGEGQKVHAFVVKTGLDFDAYVCNSLMDIWEDVNKVRSKMKDLGIKKVPGCDSSASSCPFCILEKQIMRSLCVAHDALSKIQSYLRIFAEHFCCGRQEDVKEFLHYIIDACYSTCLRLKKFSRKGDAGDANGGNVSVVKDILCGALQCQVKCLCCRYVSNKVDEIMDNSLDVFHSCSVVRSGGLEANVHTSSTQCPCDTTLEVKGHIGAKIDKVVAFEEVWCFLASCAMQARLTPRRYCTVHWE
ncbi:Tetratricopeptide-like helical domain superfamily [Sesbania bispinosa]|nr:Tetratricopeptide-like helical domain superfamily [Sesbania bispinosa]